MGHPDYCGACDRMLALSCDCETRRERDYADKRLAEAREIIVDLLAIADPNRDRGEVEHAQTWLANAAAGDSK